MEGLTSFSDAAAKVAVLEGEAGEATGSLLLITLQQSQTGLLPPATSSPPLLMRSPLAVLSQDPSLSSQFEETDKALRRLKWRGWMGVHMPCLLAQTGNLTQGNFPCTGMLACNPYCIPQENLADGKPPQGKGTSTPLPRGKPHPVQWVCCAS